MGDKSPRKEKKKKKADKKVVSTIAKIVTIENPKQ